MNVTDNLYGKRNKGGIHGDVFTAPETVSFMLDQVRYTADRDLRDISIIEPSCGNGDFVVEIARRLVLSAKHFGFDANVAFRNHVKAYDIDAKKVEHCRHQLLRYGIDASNNIQVADFLRVSNERVDIVVGNPPYVRYENIPAPMRDYCKATFSTFHYRSDLYVPFFEKSLKMLQEGGIHCFICSNRWLKNEYGKKLRQLISSKYHLHKIIYLEDADAFQEDVLAYPAITLISAQSPALTFDYAECHSTSELHSLRMCSRQMPMGADWTEAFTANSSSVAQLFSIEQLGFKIGIGVATGADSVFVSKELPNVVESELIMPGINAKDLRGNQMNWQGEYLLNPYKPNGDLVNLEDYPRAKSYLESHRNRLSSRHVAKKAPSRWYKTIDRISASLLKQPKILLPDMSGNTYVFIDEGNFYPLHNIYYVTGGSNKQLRLLAAFLMSDFVREQLSAVTNRMKGGFARWQSQHIRKLRFPDITAIPEVEAQTLIEHYEHGNIEAINRQVAEFVQKPLLLSKRKASVIPELTLQFID